MDVSASGIISTNAVKPTVMKGRLTTSFDDVVEREELIEPDVGQEVQAAVEEGEQPEHAPIADEHVPLGQLAQRRDERA